MADRFLNPAELADLKSGKTLKELPYFINVFKNDVMEPDGRNKHFTPSLYEMVLLEILAKLETLQNQVIQNAITIKRLERK